MDSANPNGWSGELDEFAEDVTEHQRRAPERRCVRLAECRARHTEASAAEGPAPSSTEEDVLQKFDLGMVPASVTPPPTWRRAAWFAVLSSAATLGGLVLVTTALIPNAPTQQAHQAHQAVELPHIPRGHDYPRPAALSDSTVLGMCGIVSPRRTPGASESVPPETSAPRSPVNVRAASPRNSAPQPPPSETGSRPHSTADRSRPPEARPRAETEPPPQESVVALAEQQHVGETRWSRMRELTQRYFSTVAAGELHEAHRMTSGRLRRADFAEFAAPYETADTIEVVATDTVAESTVTELRLERDGRTRTAHRRLLFDGDQRQVIADVPVSSSATP